MAREDFEAHFQRGARVAMKHRPALLALFRRVGGDLETGGELMGAAADMASQLLSFATAACAEAAAESGGDRRLLAEGLLGGVLDIVPVFARQVLKAWLEDADADDEGEEWKRGRVGEGDDAAR